jgi:hypothetical protein
MKNAPDVASKSGKPEEKRHLGDLGVDGRKTDLTEVGW